MAEIDSASVRTPEPAAVSVPVVPDTKGFGKAIEAEASGEANEAGNKLGQVFAAAFKVGAVAATAAFKVGVSAATAAVDAGLTLVSAVTKEFGALQQSVGAIEAQFGGASQQMIGYANDAYKTAGLSANAYLGQVTAFSSSLIQGLGGDTSAAADVANRAVIDMADNASKFGTSIGDIQSAYQGFSQQNYAMLENLKLGYGGTASEMARLVNDSGVLGDTFTATAENIDDVSFDKIIEALSVTQERMGITGAAAEAASSTILGSFGMLQGSWTNLIAGLGDANADVGQLFDNVIDSLGAVLDNIGPLIEQIAASVASLDIAGIATSLISLVESALPGILAAGTTIVTTLVQGIVAAAPALIETAIPLIMSLVSSVLSLLPLILDAALQIVVALALGIAQALPTLIPQVVNVIMQIVQTLVDNLPLLLDAALQLILGLAQGLLIALPELIAQLPAIIDGIVLFLLEAIPMIIEAATALLMAMIEALPVVLEALMTALPSIIDSIVMLLTDYMPLLLEGAVSLFWALVQAVVEITPELIATILRLIPELVLSIVGGAAKLLTAGLTMMGGLYDSLEQKGAEVREWFKGLPAKILEWLGDLGETLVDSGKKLISGFADGIGKGFQSAKNAVTDGLGKLRNLLPFSPAKEGPFSGKGWTLYSGQSLIEGLEKGMEDAAPSLLRTLAGITDQMSADLDVTAGTSALAANAARAARSAMTGFVEQTPPGDDITEVRDPDVAELLRELIDYLRSQRLTERMKVG